MNTLDDTPRRDPVDAEQVDCDLIEEVDVDSVLCPGSDETPGTGTFSNANERVAACEAAIGYVFSDRSLLKRSLTHSSSTSNKGQDNERLEFFGDAVLDLVIREYLYHLFPYRQEGELTEVKSAIVCRSTLAKASRKLNLKDFLILGRGVGRKRALPESLLANTFEAMTAAIYLDGGYEPAKRFILSALDEEIPLAMENAHSKNYKSVLQNLLQQEKKHLTPTYRVLATSGPEHARTFEVAVLVQGQELGRGVGSNKKAAEQNAARRALDVLSIHDGDEE